MCEPHIGIGPMLAVILFIPEARLGTLLGAMALGVLTYATTGFSQTFAYLREVLPLHARSEISHTRQYSLTHLLHVLGVPDTAAIIAGAACSLLMLIAGLIVARRLRAGVHDDAVFMAIPAAFMVLGGTYMHIAQIAAALPAAFLLHARLPAFHRTLTLAITLLAVPWGSGNVLQAAQPYVALGLMMLVWSFRRNIAAVGGAAIAQCMAFLAAATAYRTDVAHIQAPKISVPPDAFSEEVWRISVSAAFSGHAILFLALSAPTWCGLLLVVACAVSASRSAPSPHRARE
jgi:hypothetical protein